MMLALVALAAAQDVVVFVDAAQAEQAGIDAAEFEADFARTVEDELNLVDERSYLDEMAVAALLATKGMGVDYASNPERFVVGGSAGSAASSGIRLGQTERTLPQGGFSFQATAMAGVNLGVFAAEDSPARRVVVYANGMAMEREDERYDSELVNAGTHVQVKLVRPRAAEGGEWGGIDLTGGYELARYTLSVRGDMPIWDGKNSWDASGEYAIRSQAASVPLELSTNVRMGGLSLYLGGGYDLWRSADASSLIALDGDLTTKVKGERADLGTAQLSHSQTSQLSQQASPRAFFGVQANVLMVKAYGHINVQPSEGFGAHAGLRVAL